MISRASRVRDSAAASGTSRESALSRRSGGFAAMVNATVRLPMTSFSAPDPAAPEPGNLRLLRRLVTLLMAVMIAGFLLIVAMFVIRLSGDDLTLPETIDLPDGTRAEAFTATHDWYAVVTTDGRILIYDRSSGALRQTVTVAPAE